jgi:hypothetical protein
VIKRLADWLFAAKNTSAARTEPLMRIAPDFAFAGSLSTQFQSPSFWPNAMSASPSANSGMPELGRPGSASDFVTLAIESGV